MMTMALGIWWLAILWTYTEIVPRPFDDWKNGLLYVGAGVLVTLVAMNRKMTGGAQLLSWGPRLRGDGRSGATGPVIFLFIATSYFLLCAVSIAVSPTGRYEGILELARLVLWAGLAWGFAQSSMRTWIWLMRVTVVSAAVIALLTWMQSRGTTIWPYGGIFLAPIGHISYYGDFMAMSLVMAVGVMFLDPRWRLRPTAGMTTVVCMLLIDTGLALSATRASLVGIIAAMLLAIPLTYNMSPSPQPSPLPPKADCRKGEGVKRTAMLALVLALNLAVIFFLPITSTRGETAGTRLQQTTNISKATIDAASSGRWHTYITSAHIAMERPLLGWGLGSFRFIYPEFAHRSAQDGLVSSTLWYMHPHNEVLHQAVELGWPGAILFLFGFAYLLYRGIFRLLKTIPVAHIELNGIAAAPSGPRNDNQWNDTNKVFLITALCGLTVAFVSWQFSTNFLFPVSRLMTALFAGIILQSCHRERSAAIQSVHTGLLRGLRPLAMTTIILSTLLLIANQVSLICVHKQQIATTIDGARNDAAWAVRLAPGAFDPLFIRASTALRTVPPLLAAPAIESFYESYPYVPITLHMMGVLRAQQGNLPEARKFLQHALANDPGNGAAKQLLDQLPPGH